MTVNNGHPMAQVLKRTLTPFERGQKAYNAGCSIEDYPDGVSVEMWQDGWEDARLSDMENQIYVNDTKFIPDATGGM